MKNIDIILEAKIPKGLTKSIGRLCNSLFIYFSKNTKLRRAKPKSARDAYLVLVFLGPQKAKALNAKFRKKNYATDILSFEPGATGMGLGELVICPAILRKQAKNHGHSFKKELDYMVIHGFLHLLGYEHEKSRREELKMLKLQDKLFEKLSK